METNTPKSLDAPKVLDFGINLWGLVPKGYDIFEPKPLNKIEEFKLLQQLLQHIKAILTIPSDVLRCQGKIWLSFMPVEDRVRTRIKTGIESHHRTPVEWVSNHEIQININPDEKTTRHS